MALLARGQITISTVEDGANAVSIYVRSHAAPSTPMGTSPSGWSTNPDSFASSFGVLWVSDGLKDSNGNLTGLWSKPRMYEPYNSNLLWNFPWSLGSGSTSIYSQNGTPNYREKLPTPFGYEDIIWRGISDGNNDNDGGFNAYGCKIDHTKPYRMSCWMKMTSMDGSLYLGANGSTNAVQVYTGEEWVMRSNFYFWIGDLPELNKWYLLVGYMYGSGDTNTSVDSRAGIYDPTTGKKVLPFTQVSRNYPGVTTNGIRAYQFYCKTADVSAYFWSPRVDLLDGREPSVEELLKKSKDGEDGEPGVDANMLDWVEQWNSSKTQIGSNSVITPMIFTGVKNSNNTITGVALGEFPLTLKLDNGTITTQTINGIYGFRDGSKTFSIDSYGSAELGRGTQSIKFNALTGEIEFGSAVSMQWVGATYIDANGIFTGTLSATTISAINLSASQITSGTISADRIASGSITATKLDAASIKSSIINTDYINGLSCTFTKGTIGGWTIASGVISCGQIALNASSKRIAVYRSTSSSTSGHRVQFYYSSDTNFGFYATDSAGACIAQLGSANQIAGWKITTSAIYKNSVYLGSDGSIYNGTKWKLANDGSGQLANSNIKWDSSGNITFSSAVSLLWSTPISELADSLDANVLPKLTKITSDGVYTGTLTASQITAGTISASRIDVAAIKSTLITADNINALTLTSTKGKIGGWSITSSSIAKNSVSLGSDGTISNGSKWRLANDGSGSLAAGNISWNSAGAVTFSSAVSLLWKNDIETAKASNLGYPYYQSIVINGDEDIYYPVIFKGGDQNIKRDILIKRAYDEQAPDSWFNSTHKGGLIALIKTNFGGWGGIDYSWDIYDLSETYCRMFAGAHYCGNNCMFAVFLRGGGTTGAKYHIYSDQAIVNDTYSPSPVPPAPQIAYNSDLIFVSGSSLSYAPEPRTLTDAVESEIRSRRFIELAKSSDTTLQAHPLTYIGSTGIYTGTLTANQVNAVAISASSILAGTLNAERIAAGSIYASKLNTESIRSEIINTDYINGLSCTFTKGTIGGWSIEGTRLSCGQLVLDESNSRVVVYAIGSSPKSGQRTQIYYNNNYDFGFLTTDSSSNCVAKFGSDNIVAGWNLTTNYIYKNSVYLGSDGSIYNSNNKWKLANDGSGRVANGNITWDANGNVTFGSSVSLNWTNAANNALASAKSYTDTKSNAITDYASAMAYGKMIYRDPTFSVGTNSVKVYNNLNNGAVTITRTYDSLAPNDSKYVLRIVKNSSTATPNCGGFCFRTQTGYRKIFITRIYAKIPSDRKIMFASNSVGTGGSYKWITDTAGTGDWKEYIAKITCGTSNFADTNYFYLSGTGETSWDVSYATVFDITSVDTSCTTIDINGIYTGTITANQITAGTINASRIDTASIKSAIITADNINALTLTTSKGKIGGWNITSSYIYKNSVYFGSDGSIYNGSKWKLNNDGSGQLANGNISWTAYGEVTVNASINATSGMIGGFEIGSEYIGSVATGNGTGGGLSINDNLIRVGDYSSYALLGSNTFPSTSGYSFSTGRLTNNRSNNSGTNYGLYVSVNNGFKNVGIYSNAPMVAPAFLCTKAQQVYFTGSSFNMDFSKGNLFIINTSGNYNMTLPTESSIASSFWLSILPSDFAYIFTLVVSYNSSGAINIQNVKNLSGNTSSHVLSKGDSIKLMVSKYPAFHYQILQISN